MRPRFIQLTATAALVVGLSITAFPSFAQEAGDFEKGVAAYDSEDYRGAIKLWEPLADDGNVLALRNLAQLYRLGLGVQRDDSKAFELYEKAAERGSDEAQVNVAFQLLTGKGVEQDRKEAASWFAKAADQGNPLAQYNLGLMYEKGVGVKKDDEFAMELYNLAAAQGQRRAIARLEMIEETGDASDVEMAKAKEAADAKAKAEAEAKAEAKAKADAQAAEDEKNAELAAKAEDDTAPLEFEALDKSASKEDGDDMPAYKTEAEQSGKKKDNRPVINVVRTPTRKPGETVADAPKGNEPTPIYIIDEKTGIVEAKAPEGNDAEENAEPTDMMKVEAERMEDAEDAETAETAPTPAYVLREDATGETKSGEMAASSEKSPASTSSSAMRAPSDPVARIRFAEQAYKEGRFDDAREALSPLSRAGMPIAQFWMGRLYNRGEGVDLNRAEAYSLWRSAAAGGSERAATALANLAARLSSDEIAVAEQRHANSGRAR